MAAPTQLSAAAREAGAAAVQEDPFIWTDVERPRLRRVLDRVLRNEDGARRLQRHESCWKCFMRCFCLTPSREVHFEAAQAQHAAVVQSLALMTATYSHSSPSFATWTTGLRALLAKAQAEEDAEFDRLAPPVGDWPALHNVLKLGILPPNGMQDFSDSMLLDLARLSAHFARFSMAAYSNRLYGLVAPATACLTLACCISEHRAFSRMSGVSDDDILDAETVARPFKPVVWVCRDRASSSIVVAIRGTFSMSDVLSDVLATQVLYKEHVVHEGVLASARWVYSRVAPLLQREVASGEFTGKIVVTGHSLGGAVAALAAWLLREEAGLQVRGFVFGVPQVIDQALAHKMEKFVVGVIHGRDMVPMLSQKSVEDLRAHVSEAAQTAEERLEELHGVLAQFHLPSEPAQLHEALSQLSHRQLQVPTPRRNISTSTSTTLYEDAATDAAELPAIPMHNPGWQLHLRRRALGARTRELKPILWRSSMEDFLITISTPTAASMQIVRPAWTMWQDHWPQAYLYACEALADRLADALADQPSISSVGLPAGRRQAGGACGHADLRQALHRVESYFEPSASL